MAKRIARTKMPLEWKTDAINITDITAATATNGKFDLDLLPDEIAAILRIDSYIGLGDLAEIDGDWEVAMYLSMDPDADRDPISISNLEDLEIFFSHYYKHQQGITTTGMYSTSKDSIKTVDFTEFPILVGTNFSQVINCIGPTDFGGTTIDNLRIITTVYFKRRKANAMELNQILLKRR